MTDQKLDITPQTKIGELLDAYPELEELLISIAPPFKKLSNPVLRRTVAKVTSIAQAARVGSVEVGQMVGQLRAAVGLSVDTTAEAKTCSPGSLAAEGRPDWFDSEKIVKTIDARPMIEAGEQPVGLVLAALAELAKGEILELITPFEPAPLIDQAKAKGFAVFSQAGAESVHRSFFSLS